MGRVSSSGDQVPRRGGTPLITLRICARPDEESCRTGDQRLPQAKVRVRRHVARGRGLIVTEHLAHGAGLVLYVR